mgnify:CR=1 FL=1
MDLPPGAELYGEQVPGLTARVVDGAFALDQLPQPFSVLPNEVGPVFRNEEGADAVVDRTERQYVALADLVEGILVRKLQIRDPASLQQFPGNFLPTHLREIHHQETGIEIPESTPHIATEYPVTAAIGQSDNNYATVHLGRYVTAVANRGTVYDLTLLSRLTDSSGEELEEFLPTIKNRMNDIDSSTWSAIQRGNAMVVEESAVFQDFPVTVAGKTGTAQQVTTRPNHALFVCYAPYDASGSTVPSVAIATRIAYGYSSSNAAEVTSRILLYYFGYSSEEELLSGEAETTTSTNRVTD